MAFSSKLFPGEPIVDHATPSDVTHLKEFGRGYMSEKSLFGKHNSPATPFPRELVLSENEIIARVQEAEERGSRLSDMILMKELICKDQKQTNYCFPAGTLIRLADGSHKPIEAVKVLDQVVSAEGNVRRVMETYVHDVSEPIYNLKLWGHGHLKCTAEHPILTQRGYVPVSKIKIGDKVAMPKHLPESVKMIATGDYLYEKNSVPQAKHEHRYRNGAASVGSSFVRGIPGKTATRITKTPVPDVIHLTPEFGKVVGFYLAEGHTAAWSVHFSFNATEEKTLAAECVAAIKASLGCEPNIRIRKTVCQVTIHGGQWSRLFDSLFGRGSNAKCLPPDLCSGPREFLSQVLLGWQQGDRKAKNSAASVSRHMALNMFDIANSLGMRPAFTTHQKSKVGKDGIYRQHSWMIAWADNINHGTEQDDKCLWRTVRGVEQEEFTGHVFNFAVEHDNSYIAEGIGVHNCWANAPAHCLEIKRMIQGHAYVDLSAASVAAPINNYRNQGGAGTDAIQYMSDTGIAPVSLWPTNAINRRYYTDEMLEESKNYRTTEWWELRTLQEKWSYLMLRQGACSVGYPWWSHEVSSIEPIVLDGELASRDRNNWGMGYGYKGFMIIRGNRQNFDECIAPAVMVAA